MRIRTSATICVIIPASTTMRNIVRDINSKELQINPMAKINIPIKLIMRPILYFFICVHPVKLKFVNNKHQ